MEKEIPRGEKGEMNRKKRDFLYIFLHIPKTGGSTIKYHIKKNFKEEEIFEVDNLKSPEDSWEEHRKKIRKYLVNLNEEKKKKLRVVIGHNCFYGIHKSFNKESRYILFLRNPVSKIISMYNFILGRLKDPDTPPRIKDEYLRHELSNFFCFFSESPDMQNETTKTLMKFFEEGPINKGDNKQIEKLKKRLQEVYFIGMSENPNDYLYVYSLLRIKKFYFNKNISKRYFFLRGDKEVKKEILIKNKLDLDIYKWGLKLNREFKNKQRDFNKKTFFIKLKKTFFIPFSFFDFILIKTYNISFELRKKFKSYSRCLDLIKEGLNLK